MKENSAKSLPFKSCSRRLEEVSKQMQQHSSLLAAAAWSEQLIWEVVTEKPKLSEPLKRFEAFCCVEMVQCVEPFDTIKYGDICWPIFDIA